MQRTERKRSPFMVWVGVVLGLIVLVVAVQRATATADTESDEIVVKLTASADIEAINADYGTTTVRPLLNSASIYLLRVAEGADASAIVTDMSDDGRFQYAELNYPSAAPEANGVDTYAWPQNETEETLTTEQDPRLLYEWELASSDSARYYNQPATKNVNLAAGQAISDGAGVIVAVLDTGVDLYHPLLVAHLTAARYDFIDEDATPADEFNGLDDDGDGFVDEVAGHGTHVAGIIHLVAPAAQIMPLRVLDSDGQGNSFVIAEAMLYAVEHGADAINASLGTIQESAFLQDVLGQVTADGVIVVGAAGNMNLDMPQYPAASECALAVTAVGPGLHKADYASYGVWVDVSAPGDRIYSTYPGGVFSWWKGTSMSTPFVTGQAALLRSVDATLSIADVSALITDTAHSVDQQNPDYAGLIGSGRVDIGASLTTWQNGGWITTETACN